MAADNVIEFLIRGDASGANKAFGSLNSAVSGVTKVLGSLGVAFGAIEFAKFIGRQIDVADQMLKISQKTGVATETLSQLEYVFRLNDASAQDMESSFKFLNKSIVEANTGNRAAQISYESLGISLKDLKEQSPDEIFLRVAEAVSQIEDPATRTTILLDKFGRGGLALAPAMAEGREGIEKLMRQADALGLTIGPQFAKEADRFNDNMTTIGQAAAGQARQGIAVLLPIVNETIEALFNFGDTGEESILPWGKIFVSVIGTVAQAIIGLKAMVGGIADAVAGSFQAVGGMLGAMAASVEQALTGNFKGAVQTLQDGWSEMGAKTSETLAAIDKDLQSSADSINRLGAYMEGYGAEVTAAGEATRKAGQYTLDPVSKEAAQRLEALRKQQEDFISGIDKANAQATGNKLALLDTEYEQQSRQIADLQFQGQAAVEAQARVDAWYYSQRAALQDDALARLGIADEQFRARQIELAEQDAERMVELGLSQEQADKMVKSTLLQQQLAYMEARNALIAEDQLAADEAALLRAEMEALNLQLALEQEMLTKEEYGILMNENLAKREAARTAIVAQQEAARGNIVKATQAQIQTILAQAEVNRLNVAKMSLDAQLKYTGDALGAITGLMESENKTQFAIGKAAAVAQAVIATYTSAVNAFQSASAIPMVGWILGPIAAAAAIAMGMANVNKIRSTQYTGKAHAGLSNVPAEGTYLLDKGERVLSPGQNEDLEAFMAGGSRAPAGEEEATGGGGVRVGSVSITVQVPDSAALIGMTLHDWEEIVSYRVIPAFNRLDQLGVRPNFVQRYGR